MIINKITTGFVIQSYDTVARKYIAQNFVAGEVAYENANGGEVDETLMRAEDGSEPYLPFDMVQPYPYEKN